MAGHAGQSDALFAAYQKVWPRRSTWSLEARSPQALSKLPGFRRFILALEDAGMRRYGDERSTIASQTCGPVQQASPTALVAGFQSIDTRALADLRKAGTVKVVDFGVGAAVPEFAELSLLNPASPSDMIGLGDRLRRQGATAIVTMGSGPQDPRGCKAAGLLARGATPVYWYGGGEEAWAKAGLPSTDQR
jgi:hypothetical protein